MEEIQEKKQSSWRNKPRLILWASFYIFAFSFLLNNSLRYLDTDLGWHIKVGEKIIQEQKVPSLDYYDYTLEGKNWVDHEWLSNVIIAFVYDRLGYMTLTIFFVLIVLAALGLIVHMARKILFSRYGNSIVFDAILAILLAIGLPAISSAFGIRVQEMTFLLVSVLLLLLINYTEKRKIAYLLVLPPLFWIWTMLHGGFTIGFLMMAVWISVLAFQYFWKNLIKKSASNEDIKFPWLLTVVALASLVATFLTPYGKEIYGLLWDYCHNTYYMKSIVEWRPIYYFPLDYYKIYYLSTYSVLLFFYFTSNPEYKKKESNLNFDSNLLAIFLMSLILFACSIKFSRNFTLFFIFSLPVLMHIIHDLFIKPGISKQKKYLTSIKIIYIIPIGLFFLSICLFLMAPLNAASNPFGKYCHYYPCGATKFLKENPQYDSFNLFNYYGWGGYLIYEYPERKLFIDGRMPQYTFQNHSFLEEYLEFYDYKKISEKIKKYDIKLILIAKNRESAGPNWFERKVFLLKNAEDTSDILKKYLQESASWKEIYEDSASLLYARN